MSSTRPSSCMWRTSAMPSRSPQSCALAVNGSLCHTGAAAGVYGRGAIPGRGRRRTARGVRRHHGPADPLVCGGRYPVLHAQLGRHGRALASQGARPRRPRALVSTELERLRRTLRWRSSSLPNLPRAHGSAGRSFRSPRCCSSCPGATTEISSGRYWQEAAAAWIWRTTRRPWS